LGVVDRDGVAGEVDKKLFSCFIVLAQRDIEGLEPCPESQAELAVLVAFRVLLLVFMPKELEGDVLSRELVADVIEGGHVPPFHFKGNARRKKAVLQGGVIEVLGKGP